MSKTSMRSTTTRRGLVYSYHYNPSVAGKPTILFLHGFPCTRHEWVLQIAHFSRKGYGVIAPDLLGYGDTSAPDDVQQYKMLDMAQDIIDILKDLSVDKVIGVGHDWGCFFLSRLLNLRVDHFIGAMFLAVPYSAPQPDLDFEGQAAAVNKIAGYDVFGYWKFFSADDAPALTEKNIDSFYSLIFPNDPAIWKTHVAPKGRAREWIEQNKQLPRAEYWTAEQQEAHKQALLKKGLRGPYNWYKAWTTGINHADETTIPVEAYQITIPTFFGGMLKDRVSLPSVGKVMMGETCSNLVTKDFDVSHWITLEAPGELNEALSEFFRSFE